MAAVAAASSKPSSSSTMVSNAAPANPINDLTKEIRSHKVAIAELNNLSSSRAVYQKNGTLFFRTTVEKAKASEQSKLDAVEAKLRKLNSA